MSRPKPPTATGKKVIDVQKCWRGIYNLPDFPCDGWQCDRLFKAGEKMPIGALRTVNAGSG